MRKTALLFALVLVTALASVAAAADVQVTNSVDVRLSLTFTYTDEASGTMTTKGWWHVDPGQTVTISLPASSSAPIYLAAFNKDQYIDRSGSREHIVRYASSKTFSYAGDSFGAPGEGWWSAKFYRVSGASISISGRSGR